MNVIFVNRFFHPGLAPTGLYAADVAFDLVAAGYKVHAVTSRLAYDGNGPGYAAEETVRGVHVHRVWITRFGRGSLAGRALDYLSFYLSAFIELAGLLNRNDIVLAKTDPPLISVVAAFAALLRGARAAPRVGLRGKIRRRVLGKYGPRSRPRDLAGGSALARWRDVIAGVEKAGLE